MFKLYRNFFYRQKAGLEPVLKLQGERVYSSKFSIPLLKFSDSHTKKKIPGHLDKKVVLQSLLQPKLVPNYGEDYFFLFILFGLHQVLVANSRNSGLGFGGIFFYFFGLHLDMSEFVWSLSHSDCVCYRLRKRPSMQHFAVWMLVRTLKWLQEQKGERP